MTKGIALLLLWGCLLAAGEKKRAWHDAKVIDAASATGGYQDCAFDDGKYVYYTSTFVSWHREGVHLIVNESAKIAVDHQKLYIMDSGGKEHTMRIVKQIAKSN